MTTTESVQVYADSARGQFIPQHFAESHADEWQGIDADDKAILLAGPEHEHYNDAWINVLDNAYYLKVYGQRFELHHDGDLFAICPALMTIEELENFQIEVPTEKRERFELLERIEKHDDAADDAADDDELTGDVLTYLQEHHSIEYANSYGEHGYILEPEQKGILLANWNDVQQSLHDYIESVGYVLEWCDEWLIDYDNDAKAYRTQADSHSWTPQTRVTDNGELLTPDDDIEDWLEYAAATDHAQPMHTLPDFITPAQIIEAGYTLHSADNQNGHHVGQNDNPTDISKHIFETVENVESVVFQITGSGQFDINFSAYYKLIDADEEC